MAVCILYHKNTGRTVPQKSERPLGGPIFHAYEIQGKLSSYYTQPRGLKIHLNPQLYSSSCFTLQWFLHHNTLTLSNELTRYLHNELQRSVNSLAHERTAHWLNHSRNIPPRLPSHLIGNLFPQQGHSNLRESASELFLSGALSPIVHPRRAARNCECIIQDNYISPGIYSFSQLRKVQKLVCFLCTRHDMFSPICYEWPKQRSTIKLLVRK